MSQKVHLYLPREPPDVWPSYVSYRGKRYRQTRGKGVFTTTKVMALATANLINRGKLKNAIVVKSKKEIAIYHPRHGARYKYAVYVRDA